MPPITPGVTTNPAAGGVLVLENRDAEVFVKPVLAQAGALQALNPVRTNSARTRFTEVVDVGEPGHTEEAAKKNVGGVEFATHELSMEKYTLIIPVSTELLDDAAEDPFALVTPKVITKFAQLLDAEALGRRNGAAHTSHFDSTLIGSVPAGNVIELGSGPSALQDALSGAMGVLEDTGRTKEQMRLILPSDAGRVAREAKRGDGSGDYFYGQSTDPFWDLRRGFSTNLNRIGGAADPDGAVAVVVDPDAVRFRIRQQLTIERSDVAAITIGGQLVSLWENNLVALKFEMRAGMVVLDPEGIAVVRNAA